MKRQIAMIALLFLGMGMTASAQFGKKFNVGKALQAGKDVVSAVTLSDADIANMSKEYMVWMDAHNPLTKPDTEYGKRLEKLTGHIKEMDGLKLNFGVYEVVDVNAFACGDGSVRICAGLMDVMTDEEVMAVVGHEIGHVVHTDSKDAMKNAYLRSAVKNAAGAASNKVAKLTDSELGAMAEALAGEITAGDKILLARAKVAREVLPESLRKIGAIVDVVTAYETVADCENKDELIEALESGEASIVTFTSSSTVTNLLEVLGDKKELLNKAALAAIGPVTADTLKKLSLIHI